MERGVRSLIRLSRMMRGTKILTNYAASTQGVLWNTASYSRGKAVINDFRPVNNVDTPMMVYRDVNDIFAQIRKNEANISSVDATRLLQMLQKHDGDTTPEEIKQREEFLLLCTKINKGVRKLNVYEIMIAIRSLHYFKISSKTVIMQTLLQLLRVSINEIPFWWIPTLHRAICQMDSVPLVDVLQKALPIVFNLNISDVDKLPLHKQVLCLNFAHEHYNVNSVDVVVESLLNYKNEMDAKNCLQILSVLHQMSATKQSTELYGKVIESLANRIKHLDYNNLYRFLKGYRHHCSTQTDVYNERILDAICNTAMNNFTFLNILKIQFQLNLMQYTSIPILDYLAAKIFEDPSICENVQFNLIAQFIKGLSVADYKPIFWDYVLQILLQSLKRKYTTEQKFMWTTLRLAALDCYDESLLQHAFRIPIRNIQVPMEYAKLRAMLHLYQAVKTLYPTYNGPWPDSQTIKLCHSSIQPHVSDSLQGALEHALGGPQYVKSHLKTKLSHFIDHMVVIDQDGHPIAINNETDTSDGDNVTYTYIEDVQIPSSSNRILIFNFPRNAYSINTRRLYSEWILRVRSLEAYTGCSGVVINCFTWDNLQEHEKIPYLKQAIKLRAHEHTKSPYVS